MTSPLGVARLLILALGAAACGTGREHPPPATPQALGGPAAANTREVRYALSADADLTRLDVQVCFVGAVPQELNCSAAEGADAVRDARLLGANARALRYDAHRIYLAGVHEDACIAYAVDLRRAERREPGPDGEGRAVWLSNADWLWRPRGSLADVELSASFRLPEGVRFSVPWPVDGEVHRLDSTVFAFKSYLALGAIEHEQIERAGAVIDAAIVPGFTPSTRGALRPWLIAQADAAALGGAGFPATHVQVLVVPTENVGQPVHFGTTFRGGGASLLLYVSRDAQAETLRADWVALHELCHLRLPFLARRDAWLSEGLATYHQEVLRVRAGLLEPAVAWARLFQGARLRYGADESLAVESEQMPWKHNYPLVYWSGAAFALLADVALRERSAGARSLDTVLAEVTRCCAVSERPWSGAALLSQMDGFAGDRLFGSLYSELVVGPALPELDVVYRRLGLEVREGRATPTPNAELAWVRDAIMAPPPR